MKLSFAFIATVSAQVITFKDSSASLTNGDCDFVYKADGELTTQGCDIATCTANTEAIAAHRTQMAEMTQSIANTVCHHAADPTMLIKTDGSKQMFSWAHHGSSDTEDTAYGGAFCRYDCATGHHDEDGDGKCIECITSCATGYKFKTGKDVCTQDSQTECEQDTNFCPNYFDMAGAVTDTPSARHYGFSENVACRSGKTAVGSPSITCGADGQWIVNGFCATYNKVGSKVWDTVNMHSGIRECAGSTTATCPSGYVAVGGGMANYYRELSSAPTNFGTTGTETPGQLGNGLQTPGLIASTLFQSSRPNGNKGWTCDMGPVWDCGRIDCFVTCVPENTMEVKTQAVTYDHYVHGLGKQNGLGTKLRSEGTVHATCDAGWTVTGVGMVNHQAHTYDSRALFEEYSYEGNAAKCNMGAPGTVPEFTCYATCAKAKRGKAMDCQTVTSQPGLRHNIECSAERPNDRVTGAGIKQTKAWGSDTNVLHMFENAQPKSQRAVHCDSGHGDGENVCQARCCHVHDMN